MDLILQYGRENPVISGAWFLLLAAMACIVGKLVKWEPMISAADPPGRGRNDGKLNQRWWRILPAKFLGGFLSLLAGLSSGKRGSVHPDRSYTGKAVSKALDRGRQRKDICSPAEQAQVCSGISCPSCGSHVFLLKRFIRIFLYLY